MPNEQHYDVNDGSTSKSSSCKELIGAIERGQLHTVSLLLRGREKELLCFDHLHRSALSLAANQGNCGVVHELASNGYDLETPDKHGLTPLSYAAWKGNTEVVSYLLDSGVDSMPFDQFGVSPVHKAAAFGHVEVLQALLDPRSFGQEQRSPGVPPNLKTREPQAPPEYEAQSLLQTPLHLAVFSTWAVTASGRADVVRLLLEHGANVNSRDREGETALHYAARTKEWGVVRSLVLAGADTQATNARGKRPCDLMAPPESFFERLVSPILYWYLL
jgi:ankyrin repeat protein